MSDMSEVRDQTLLDQIREDNDRAEKITRLIRRRNLIDAMWEELEEAGKLRYFGTSCLKPWPYSLNCQRIQIVAQLVKLGMTFEQADRRTI